MKPASQCMRQLGLWYSKVNSSVPGFEKESSGSLPLEVAELQRSFFYVFYAFAIGSPRGMQIEQRGRTDAVPVTRYSSTTSVINFRNGSRSS